MAKQFPVKKSTTKTPVANKKVKQGTATTAASKSHAATKKQSMPAKSTTKTPVANKKVKH